MNPSYPTFLPTTSTPVLPTLANCNCQTSSTTLQPHPHPAPPLNVQPTIRPLYPPPFPTLLTKPTIIWLRNDLRLHDHPLFHQATKLSAPIVPLYILPNRPLHASLVSSLHSLRNLLRLAGSDLYVRPIHPFKNNLLDEESVGIAQTIGTCCQAVNAGVVLYGYADRKEEQRVEKMVMVVLRRMGVEMRGMWTNGLYVPEMLPFDVHADDFPEDCDAFDKRVKRIEPMAPLPPVERIRGVTGVECGEIPMCGVRGGGGEERGLQWLEDYCDGKGSGLVEVDGIRVGVKFRGMGRFVEEGGGCLSVRWVWWRVARGENMKRYCAQWDLILVEYERLVRLRQLERVTRCCQNGDRSRMAVML